ncbi:hypothetical protein GCM10027355_35840 [Haloplanus salinarum]
MGVYKNTARNSWDRRERDFQGAETPYRPTCGATCIAGEPVRLRMATEDAPEETKVSDRGIVTIPATLRRRLDIKAGDKLRWDDEGNLSVEVVKQRYGAFDDFEPVSMGGGGSDTHDLAGHEDDPTFSESS